MKIIDIYNKVANGEEVPHFIIDEIEYYIGTNGFVKDVFGEEVEWTIDRQWLNEEVQILEEVEDKEYEFVDIDSYISNVGRVDESNIEEYIHILFNQQSTLIQNQKYILERLDK